MQKQRRVYTAVLLLVLAAIFLYLTYIRLKDNDCFEKTTTEAGYIDLGGVEEEDITDAESILYAEGLQQIYFYSGTYKITVEATAASDNSWCQVIDVWTNTVLAEFSYTAGSNTYEVWFTAAENYENVVVRSYVSPVDVRTVLSYDGDLSGILEISSYTLRSDGAVCSDGKWTIVLFVLLFMLMGYGAYRMVCRKRPALLAVTTMAWITSLPFFIDYLPSGNDWGFHINRIFSLGQSFLDGQIPQHMSVTMGTSGITPGLYPELVLYFAGFLCAMGATAWFGYQVTCVLITFLTAFIAYYSARQVSGERSALAFTFVYLANPYRLNDIFIRAAIGEAFGMAFLPLIVAGMWEILCCTEREDHRNGTLALVLGYTGMISSNIIMVVISAFTCVMMVAVVFLAHPARFIRKVRRLWWIILAAFATVLLNLWFLVPFLQLFGLDTNISVADSEKMQYTGPYLWQVFMGVVGQGRDNQYKKTAASEISLTVGFALLLGLIFFTGMVLIDFMNSRKDGAVVPAEGRDDAVRPSARLTFRERKIGGMCLIMALVFLYMSSPYFPWEWVLENLEILEMTLGRIQFSWRLLTVVALMLSVVLVVVLRALHREQSPYSSAVSVGLVLICLYSAVSAGTHYFSDGTAMEDKFTVPVKINTDYVLSWADIGTVRDWYLSGEGPVALAEEEEGASVAVDDYYRDGTDYVFTYSNSSDQDVAVTVPVLWYALHEARFTDGESGEKTVLASSMNTTLQFTDIYLPAGSSGTVSLEYVKPLKWKIADGISLASLIAFAAALIYGRRKRKCSAQINR